MRYLTVLGLFFALSFYCGAVQFSCPQKGTVTIWEAKQTQTGEVVCVKQKFTFSGSIALPDPQKGEIYTLKCQKPKGGRK